MTTFQPVIDRPGMAPRVQGKIDLKPLNRELELRNFKGVLDSQELFKNLFYKANLNNSSQDEYHLKTTLEGTNIRVIGNSPTITDIEEAIEWIRNRVLESVQSKRPLTIFPINIAENIRLYSDRDQGPKSKIINCQDWLCKKRVKVTKTWYLDHLQPNLSEILQTIGLNSAFENKSIRCQLYTEIPIDMLMVETIEISSKKGELLTYPIPPTKIEEHGPLDHDLYSMYKKKEDCDLTIVTNDGEVHLHKLVLKARGGEVLKTMLSGSTKEAKESKIDLTEKIPTTAAADETAECPTTPRKGFTKETVEAFVDYLYLGASALEQKIVPREEFDFWELLRFAHTYDLQPLINCATNLIGLYATQENKEDIKIAADRYENKYLQKLCEYLSAEESVQEDDDN